MSHARPRADLAPRGPRRRLAMALAALVLLSCSSSSTSPTDVDPGPACPDPVTGLPDDLYCTGLYADRTMQALRWRVQPYTPGVTLWSDGAEKHRFLFLPPGATIDTSDLDAWKFPMGTRVWKEFRVDGVLVETRFFWKRSATDWEAGTYVWDSTGTAATLNTASKGTVLPGGYEIPTRKDCDRCHHGGSDKLLGVEAVALGLPRAQGATLAALVQQGALSHPPAVTSITLPEDSTGKAGEALGYLHANCGMPCHSSRGLGDETKLVMRLRAGEFWPDGLHAASTVLASDTDTWKATARQKPTTASVAQAFPGAERISPGAHDQSLVWLVASRRGKYQMPPLVSHKVDDVAMQRLADWIDALPP